jgi:hypothetical protein
MWHCITVRPHINQLLVAATILSSCSAPVTALVAEGERAPDIVGQSWINSSPLNMAGLGGRVVLVEFWTYG